MRKLYILGLIALAAVIIGLAWAEQLTFTTYYPAPYGVYREFVVAHRQTIGDLTGDGQWNADDMAVYPPGHLNAGEPIPGSLTVANNVGIGTTEPAGIFHVAGGTADSGSGRRIILQAENGDPGFDTDGGNIILLPGRKGVAGADGNVGIGTTSPGGMLHVYGAGRSKFDFHSTTDTNITRTAVNCIHSTTQDMVDGFATNMMFSIEDSSGTLNDIGFVEVIRDGADNSSKMRFATYKAGTGTRHLTIDSDGNVGIGTTSPDSGIDIQRVLHIAGSDHAGLVLEDTAATNKCNGWTNTGNFMIRSSDSSVSAIMAQANGNVIVSGCISDGTCEIFAQEDALSIIKSIMSEGDGRFDEYGHEHINMEKVHSKYPYLIDKQEVTEEKGKKEIKYFDKLGAKSDLLYRATMQLVERFKALEKENENLRQRIDILEGLR